MRDTATVVFEGQSMTRVYQEILMKALIEKIFEYSQPVARAFGEAGLEVPAPSEAGPGAEAIKGRLRAAAP